MLFHYSDRYRSGAILLSEVTGWKSQGEAYYLTYTVYMRSGEKHYLNYEEFFRFSVEYAKFEESQNANVQN